MIWRVLALAFADIAAFMFILSMIISAYAVMGSIAFGDSIRQFHTLSESMFTLMCRTALQ